jgi:acyl-CoA dehydrogenase
MRRFVFPLGRPYVVPSDKLGHQVARLLVEPSATRDRLTAGVARAKSDDDPIGVLDRALAATLAAEPIEAKLRTAIRQRQFDPKLEPGDTPLVLADRARAAGVVSADEASALKLAYELMARVVRVDDFAQDLGASEMRPPVAKPTSGPAPALVEPNREAA